MAEYKNFIRKDLGDGYVVCEDVHLLSDSVCTVYFSPRNIYVLSSGTTAPLERYREIRDLLRTSRFRLYLLDPGDGTAGLYDQASNTLGIVMNEDDLTIDIDSWLSEGYVSITASVTEQMIQHLKDADIHARGYAVQDTGEIYLLRNGTIRKASPVSSDLQYYLTLFGGTLGLHKFAMGKVMTGLLYLFSGGLFLVGWLMDLLQLFLGIQKDRKKQYLLPLNHPGRKLLILPLGLAVGALLFQSYLKLSEAFGMGIGSMVAHQIRGTNPKVIENLMDLVNSYASR